jgi:hypothetical protein
VRHADWVYDFALPPLILHTLYTGDGRALKHWLDISPRNAGTVLDTHDGIGALAVGPDRKSRPVHCTPDRRRQHLHSPGDSETRSARHPQTVKGRRGTPWRDREKKKILYNQVTVLLQKDLVQLRNSDSTP